MTSWCYNHIVIRSKDNAGLKKFAELLSEWTSEKNNHGAQDGYERRWLGNIVINSGIGSAEGSSEHDDGRESFPCYGTMDYCCFQDLYQLEIDTDTAGCPTNEMWKALIEKYLPDAEFRYSSEIEDHGIYLTNIPELVGDYVVDEPDAEDGSVYVPAGDLRKKICDFLATQSEDFTDDTPLEELIDMVSEYNWVIDQWEYED